MLILAIIFSIVTFATTGWASIFNQTGLPPCPSGSSASPKIPCVGPGYTSNDTKITWPNSTASWSVGTFPVVDWDSSTSYTKGELYLYNRNVTVLPQRVALLMRALISNGSSFSEERLSESLVMPAAGYWLVLVGRSTVPDTFGMNEWILASSQEFEVKPKGTKVNYPAAYASLSSQAERTAVGVPLVAVLGVVAMSAVMSVL
ncbi:hypothetical protein Q8F55_005394 [Vanrija albida]|uniref:Uncharacterized protein n=1 Tax=Vanrija albida TaxID=181172 RepID=A0ABR3Q1J2_9TREE